MGANLDGAFALSRALLPRMVRRGSGHLVFVSSFQALRGNPGASLYAASKAGLIGLCKSIASEYGAKNIRCNAILPGFLDSKMTRDLPRSARLRAIRENCLKRANDPLEVARFIHFLTGTRNISGQVFNLDSRILSR
jgi:3-oxoacyl-[acyl-carrier protein] reductase